MPKGRGFQAENPMKIEEGKFYVDGWGTKRGPARLSSNGDTYVWRCGLERYTKDGQWHKDYQSSGDLVAEWKESLPLGVTREVVYVANGLRFTREEDAVEYLEALKSLELANNRVTEMERKSCQP
jgi:hypothetical protein